MRPLSRPVSELMSSPVVSIGVQEDLAAADRLLREHAISSLLVRDRTGAAAGVVTRTDLLQVAHAGKRLFGTRAPLALPSMCVGDLMTAPLLAVTPETPAPEAAQLMVERHVHRVFVQDGATVVGVFSTKDAMRAVLEARVAAPISTYMSSPVVSVEATETLSAVVDKLARAGIAGVVVLDVGRAIGLFTQVEALEARSQPQATLVEEAMTQSMVCLPLDTPLFRAAGFTLSTRARRVLATDHHQVRGILTGLDFTRACAAGNPPGPGRIAATA